MREFEFRVWDKKNNQMVRSGQGIGYVNFDIDLNGKLTRETLAGGFESVHRDFVQRADYVIQQYTGLKDKKGKKIFESDILKSDSHAKVCNYVVMWSEGRSEYCGFALNPVMLNPPKRTFHIHDFSLWMAHGFEVIGNMFENPELLALPATQETVKVEEPELDLAQCPQCEEKAWDGRICHVCGAKNIGE